MVRSNKPKIVLLFSIIFSLVFITCGGEESGGRKELETQADKFSYALGVNIGNSIKMNNMDVDVDILGRAIKDILTGGELALSQEEMMLAMQNYQLEQQARLQSEMTENLAKAHAFLEENARKPGITTLPDSLQYEVLEEGTGSKPKPDDIVRVHFRGTLLDGSEFDSSYSRGEPNEFSVSGRIIPGWTEVLQLMSVGARWKVYIPPNLAYGQNPQQGIPANSLLIFEIELLDIVDESEQQ